jgi:hypothetical protein
MPPSSSRRVRRSVAVLLAILTLALVAASRYVVPTGLGDPDTIPLLDDRYTAQISGFVDVPPAREIALAAFTPARLVVDGLVVAEVEAPGLDAAAPGVPAGVHRVLVHFVPVPARIRPGSTCVPPTARSTSSRRRRCRLDVCRRPRGGCGGT